MKYPSYKDAAGVEWYWCPRCFMDSRTTEIQHKEMYITVLGYRRKWFCERIEIVDGKLMVDLNGYEYEGER